MKLFSFALVLLLQHSFLYADILDFEAAHSIGVNAEFEGELVTDNEEFKWIKAEITEQLFYTVGALNAYQAVGDIANVEPKIIKKTPIAETGFFRVRYSANMLIGWPREMQFPAAWTAYVPLRASEKGKADFFNRYGRTCSNGDSELDAESFYYYIRPEGQKCRLWKEAPNDIATAIKMKFSLSFLNTENKYPEYHKVWEDGSLVATLIFGNDHDGATGNDDAGIWAYNSAYQSAINMLGQPYMVNLQLAHGQVPGFNNPYVEMEWRYRGGKRVNLALMLIQSKMIEKASPQFKARYSSRTLHSDYIAYNGHSGYGDNIRELAKMGNFLKGQYQIFYLFGCDTYAYVGDALGLAHQALNPNSTKTKYVDMITNAYPGLFQDIAPTNLTLIKALIEGKLTYRQILAQVAQFQRSIVTGEEDNNYPNPF